MLSGTAMNWPIFDFGVALAVGAAAAPLLIRINLWMFRKLGMISVDSEWEVRMRRWIPVVRVTCAVGAVIFLVAGARLV